MALRTITVIGSLNTDLVTVTPRMPHGGETLTATSFSTGSGGKGANQAVACCRLAHLNREASLSKHNQNTQTPSINVRMLGAVGADSFGEDLIRGMEADGIDCSGVRKVEDQTTGVAVIVVEEGTGENRILLTPGANHSLQARDFTEMAAFGSPKPDLVILQLEIPHQTVLQIMKIAKEAGIAVLLNPAPAVQLPMEALKDLDHLILNETEAAILMGASPEAYHTNSVDWEGVTDHFLRHGVQRVVITLGAKGAYCSASIGGGYLVKAGQNIKVVDTTAAGDTFVGAYAVNMVRNMTEEPRKSSVRLEETVAWACKAAGKTVERAGAQSAIPWAEEING